MIKTKKSKQNQSTFFKLVSLSGLLLQDERRFLRSAFIIPSLEQNSFV